MTAGSSCDCSTKKQMTESNKRVEFDCDAVLLDMDGTLVDSTECVVRQWRNWAERHGLELEPILAISHGRLTLETIQLVAPHLATWDEVHAFDAAELKDRQGITAIRGAAGFVSALPDDRWAVVTSASRELAQLRLECAGLPIPRVLVSANDVRRGKPHPEPYLLAAARLGMRPERCLVIEDAKAGVEAALAAGMHVIAITTSLSSEELGCTHSIASFEELHIRVRDSIGIGIGK
jgi:mannitol-1-/sugar-/sorbitol-6-phosphatase